MLWTEKKEISNTRARTHQSQHTYAQIHVVCMYTQPASQPANDHWIFALCEMDKKMSNCITIFYRRETCLIFIVYALHMRCVARMSLYMCLCIHDCYYDGGAACRYQAPKALYFNIHTKLLSIIIFFISSFYFPFFFKCNFCVSFFSTLHTKLFFSFFYFLFHRVRALENILNRVCFFLLPLPVSLFHTCTHFAFDKVETENFSGILRIRWILFRFSMWDMRN